MRDDLAEGIDRVFALAREWAQVDDTDLSGLTALSDAVFAELQRTPPHLLALLAIAGWVDSHRLRALEELLGVGLRGRTKPTVRKYEAAVAASEQLAPRSISA